MSNFDARRYGFWFVRATDRIGLGWLGGAIVLALVPYLLALVLVLPFGEGGLYLRTPAFYIGFAGVALVIAASVRGIEILTKGLSELQEVAVEPQELHAYADEQLAAAAHARSNLGPLAALAAGAIALVVGALHRWHQTGAIAAGHGFRAFPVDWRASDALAPAALALAVFAVAVVIALGGSAILLLRNLRFSWRLRGFSYVPFPGRLRLGVRTLVSAYTWVSGTWTVGVALFALFFFREWSGLNIALIAVLAAVGVLTLAVPYNSFRKMLDDAHEAMAADLTARLERQAGGDISELGSLSDFAAVNMAITADPPAVLTRRGAIAYGLVQVVAFGSIFAKDALQEQVSFLAGKSSSAAK